MSVRSDPLKSERMCRKLVLSPRDGYKVGEKRHKSLKYVFTKELEKKLLSIEVLSKNRKSLQFFVHTRKA